jgi:translation initiation factor 1 (eIF-1/SUI1)
LLNQKFLEQLPAAKDGNKKDLISKEDQSWTVNGIHDYRKRYEYQKHEEAVNNISDDPTDLDSCLAKLKEVFASGITKDPKFRKLQLQNIIKGLEEMKGEISDAL